MVNEVTPVAPRVFRNLRLLDRLADISPSPEKLFDVRTQVRPA